MFVLSKFYHIKLASLLLFLFLSTSQNIISQTSCLPGYHWLTTQYEIDHFLDSYPNCTTIEGNVFIRDYYKGKINNLDAFVNIDSIKGGFQLRETKNIKNLKGFDNLKYIGYLYVQANDSLINFAGMKNLNKVGGDFFIGQNPQLISLKGLDSIKSTNGSLDIRNNPVLEDIKALKNLSKINGSIKIMYNDTIKSLEGIENIDANTIIIDDIYYLIIKENRNLSNCDVKSICDLLGLGKDKIFVSKNKEGCQYIYEIVTNCFPVDTCLSEGYTFSSQEEIDDFPYSYEGCKEILGDIKITGSAASNIKNLLGFSNIKSISGSLKIYKNSFLKDLKGFDNLKNIKGSLLISSNNSLVSLEGLENLETIDSSFIVSFNNSLQSFNKLKKLKSIKSSISVNENLSLENLDGLENIDTIDGRLWIFYNKSLANIDGLKNLKSIGNSLTISSNNKLSSLNGLRNLGSVNGNLTISGNDLLKNLNGLEKLTSIDGYLDIFFNTSLQSLSGIQNIDPESIEVKAGILQDIEIKSNSKLSDCAVESICDFLKLEYKTKDIGHNATGCNSIEEIETDCNWTDKVMDNQYTSINIYPNPATEALIVNFENTNIKYAEIVLSDLSGKAMISKIKRQNKKSIRFSTKNLNSGFYIMKIITGDNKVFFEKALISK